MKRKLGTITIGQSPRLDVIPEMIEFLGENVEIIEEGALDGLTYSEILELEIKEDDYILVSTLRDGNSVKFAERHILPRLQICIDNLESQGADIILFICTGVFPNIFKSGKPLLYPQKIMHSVIPKLINKGKVAVIIPHKDQVVQSKKKWKKSGIDAMFVSASPYSKEDELHDVINELKGKDIDLAVMDCIGYTREMKKRLSEETGIKVILARTIVARILGEMLSSW